ncbi:hypothetical protein DYL59_22130 [Pseudomonas kairouanensis]|uniref:Uncharacterized protein n=1 Tax=Pseudomonas kairouanensis TaxID=2293832 RepID=A0A4Z0AJD9_9PSED|nr:hypothetical protein [Pseudomonas kairouanensis]TFY86481.1 hypothetical protein DYL59_22130 [Pseudomonas kairouanensis]
MKINGATPLGHPLVRGQVEEPQASSAYPSRDEQRISWEASPRQPPARRAALSSLRYQALQNAPVARANTTPPGQHSTDSQLANELDKNFGELHPFFREGRLTQSSLRSIAAQALAGD